MTYSADHKSARMTVTRDRINAGRLVVETAGPATLFSVTLDTPAGTVVTGVLTLAGFPKTVTATGTGTAASGKLLNSGLTNEKTGLTVGVPGSGAQIIIDNGLGTLVITAGASVTVAASPTLTHAA